MKSALLVLGNALLLPAPNSLVFAVNAGVPLMPIRGEVVIKRTASAWESQQAQEPCANNSGNIRPRSAKYKRARPKAKFHQFNSSPFINPAAA